MIETQIPGTTFLDCVLVSFFIFFAVTEAFFYLFFLRNLSRKNPDSGKENERVREPVSVIICLRNELDNLRKLIPALLKQDYPPGLEICLVADRSDVATLNFLRNESVRHQNIRLLEITEIPKGIAPKKNALLQGIEKASHDVLLLTDADCLPAGPDWIRQMSEHFDSGTVAVLGFGGYASEKGFLNLLIQYDTGFTALQYFGMAAANRPYMGVGRNLAYRKSAFIKAGGFGDTAGILAGDDDLFINRISCFGKINICTEPDGFTFSAPKRKWKDWVQQKIRHYSVGKFYTKTDQYRLGIFYLARTVSWVMTPALLLIPETFFLTILVLVVRLFIISYANAAGFFGQNRGALGLYLPILDFLHSIFLAALGLWARFFPPANWK